MDKRTYKEKLSRPSCYFVFYFNPYFAT